jgi:hypothetical protein
VKKKLNNCRMKDGKIGYRTADFQNGPVPEIGEHNFIWLELATRIMMVAQIRVVNIGIKIKPRARESSVDLLK